MAEADCAGAEWLRRTPLIIVRRVSPDGRRVALRVHGKTDWAVCGSERAVRGWLAKVLWKK
jgi:hypothetical protein